jgi:hypothetical protein
VSSNRSPSIYLSRQIGQRKSAKSSAKLMRIGVYSAVKGTEVHQGAEECI